MEQRIMNRNIIIYTCIFILLATSVFAAADAVIITDSHAPGCIKKDGKPTSNCHSLNITGNGDKVVYVVEDVEPETQYTVSFWYRTEKGSFDFLVDKTNTGTLSDDAGVWFNHTFTSRKGSGKVKTAFTFQTNKNTEFHLDEFQMTPSPEATSFYNFKYETGCCPYDFCWNGTGCMHDDFYENNVSFPPLGTSLGDFKGKATDIASFLKAPTGYRCINGSWKFSRAKYTPLFDGAGYCPDDTQCFNGDKSGIVSKACTESGDFTSYRGADGQQPVEYFYCHKGNWTTRTKEIARQLLDMALASTESPNTYTIFCDTYNRALNPDQNVSYFRDYIGDKITAVISSDMVNEFCVMDLNGQVIAGVSLNMEINKTLKGSCIPGGSACWTPGNCNESGCLKNSVLETPMTISFMQMLKGPDETDYCDSAIKITDGTYNKCEAGDVYYNAKLNSVIFSKPTPDIQTVPFTQTKSFIGLVFDWLRDILKDLLGFAGLANPQADTAQQKTLDFIAKAGSFDKLYISHDDNGPNNNPRDIRAIRETRATVDLTAEPVSVDYVTFISAEYWNYQVEICRFFYTHTYVDVKAQISDPKTNNIRCTPVIIDDKQWMHSIYVEDPVFDTLPTSVPGVDLNQVRIWKTYSDTFWNDITAKIRTQKHKTLPTTAPVTPITFDTDPEKNPVVDTKINFSLTSKPAQGERYIANTWDFGDGEKSSSAFNVSTLHTYAKKKKDGFKAKVCVMNNNYKISCSAEKTLSIGDAPRIEFEKKAQTEDRTLTIVVRIVGGNPKYNIGLSWDDMDTSSDDKNAITDSKPQETFSFKYKEDEFKESGGTANAILKTIKVEASDRDVTFSRSKSFTINYKAP
jgi:hypothetical protein